MVWARSKISWCDYSGNLANFVTGCSAVSPGCQNCYARAIYRRFGRDFSQVTIHEDKLRRLAQTRFEPGDKPYRRGPGSRPMVFLCDTGDLFHERVPSDLQKQVILLAASRADVDWQILTKRPERMLHSFGGIQLPPNLWLGVTAENQAMADERIPLLLQIPAAVRFVSVEPMLEPIDLSNYLIGRNCAMAPDGCQYLDNFYPAPYRCDKTDCGNWQASLHQVIVGGESGPHRRPFDPAWARAVRDQCQAAGLPFFGKQASGLRPGEPLLIDGVHRHAWPEVARV